MKGEKEGGGDKKEGSKGKGQDDEDAQTVPEEVNYPKCLWRHPIPCQFIVNIRNCAYQPIR